MEVLVSLEDVTKRFQWRDVLNQVNLSIHKGEALAIVGVNGSGKSTLLRLISGMASPTSGRIRYLGEQPARIGYVPDRFPKLRFTAFEYLRHMGLIRGLDQQKLDSRIRELLELVRLTNAGDTQIRYFSKGMLQKVGLIQAVLSEPELLVLDEPLSGLDEHTVKELVELLRQLKQQGMTLVFACHENVLLSSLADRIMRVKQGSLYVDQTDGEWSAVRGPVLVMATVRIHATGVTDYLSLSNTKGVLKVDGSDSVLKLIVEAGESDAILKELLSKGGSIVSLTRSGGDL